LGLSVEADAPFLSVRPSMGEGRIQGSIIMTFIVLFIGFYAFVMGFQLALAAVLFGWGDN
jgi:hypothetical protein